MELLRRLRFLTALVTYALAFAGCAARAPVHSYLERGADLSVYQRYSWGPADRAGTGDPRLDNNEIFQEHVQSAVDKQLATKGYQKNTSGSPDLLVHFHASVEQRIDLSNTEPFAPCESCKPFVYDAGTLVIDLVDARTNKVLWRGWSEGNVDGVVDNQRWMEERIDDDVTRIFKQLPRRIR